MSLHQYQGALLGNVWLKNGFQNHKTKWGDGFSYDDVEGLFRAIAIELCLSPHHLSGGAVRFLRKRLEMSQELLGAELGCSGQAIAKWEKGEVLQIPVAAARMIRLLVLARIAPDIVLDHAVVAYNEPEPVRMVFAYSAETGWQCAEHEHAPIPVRMSRNNVIDFVDALQQSGVLNTFDQRVFSVFAENEGEFAHACKLVAA